MLCSSPACAPEGGAEEEMPKITAKRRFPCPRGGSRDAATGFMGMHALKGLPGSYFSTSPPPRV